MKGKDKGVRQLQGRLQGQLVEGFDDKGKGKGGWWSRPAWAVECEYPEVESKGDAGDEEDNTKANQIAGVNMEKVESEDAVGVLAHGDEREEVMESAMVVQHRSWRGRHLDQRGVARLGGDQGPGRQWGHRHRFPE
jgi:hypothetical protein